LEVTEIAGLGIRQQYQCGMAYMVFSLASSPQGQKEAAEKERALM
jgi:hypothetical protein